ncbi:hypothetical protein P154DRAFT_612135 [Amniculicola lignicola CBS 123094]|uniref:Extracellular membrane protein CFEM domain-containing protein n=1 Tax=Amniculicola lignicola CBS 123094 TaxID=1392246 RepID=A0A6A5VZC0_9PLEO|nr:hypothetical protein P154DRAFT_612135 [Amniculicola lignicola CBS 123094]
MQLWKTFAVFALVGLGAEAGKNGPIGWDYWVKTPSGGPQNLRACAEKAFWDDYGSPNAHTGCRDTECVCRPDLIDLIHEQIVAVVEAQCGKGSDVDVQAALKVYNDYCSWMGWAIPGYTYIVTKTAPAPEETSAEAAVTTDTPTTTEAVVTSLATDGTPVIITLTPTFDIPPVVTETARVTIRVSSASSRLKVFSWLHTLCRIISVPINLILAIPDTVIVSVTLPPAPTLITSVVFMTPSKIPTAVEVSTAVVTKSKAPTAVEYSTKLVPYNPNALLSETLDSYSIPDGSAATSFSSGNNGTKNPGPTTLEIIGIVIGIVVGVITMVATIWVCARGSRMARNNRA